MRVLVNVMLRPLLECFNDLSYSSKDRQHPQLGLCVSCVMGFIELMTPDHYRKLRATFDVKEDLEVRMGEDSQLHVPFKVNSFKIWSKSMEYSTGYFVKND